MTVDAPEFDDTLDGHAAVAIGGSCHAVVSAYDEAGCVGNVTECGYAPVEDGDILSRTDFQDEDLTMCGDCWPEAAVGATGSKSSSDDARL